MKKSEIIRNIINDDCYYYTKHSVIEIVNFIFDEHEAQMKDKDDEIERLKKELLIATRRYDAMRVKARELEKTIKKAWNKHLKDKA